MSTMSLPLSRRNGANNTTKGVLRAIAYLPTCLRELLGTADMADLVSSGVPTDDDEGMTFKVDENITLELRPFARLIVLTDTSRLDNSTTVSYAGGFKDDDVDRVVGWYTLAKRSGASETSMHWADKLGRKLEAPATTGTPA